jgi:hypothetical protein
VGYGDYKARNDLLQKTDRMGENVSRIYSAWEIHPVTDCGTQVALELKRACEGSGATLAQTNKLICNRFAFQRVLPSRSDGGGSVRLSFFDR